MSAPCGKAPSCELCPLPDCTWNGHERKKPKKTVMSPEAVEKQRAYVKKWREQNHSKAYTRLLEYLEAWKAQEVGLSKSVLEEVLEASRRIENEVAAEREAKS